ncbi:MAG: AAA family ATPase [Clostridiales bacterium]|nr:AAA family ATPase [Clostridiales bacterium]
MRLVRIKARAFGCLKDWESPLLNPGLVLVCGRNESGKSTLFNLITTLFYGWQPANRDSNPFIPWGLLEADCEGEIMLNDGERMTVYRRLLSRPIGMLQQGDRLVDIKNRALPYVEVLPRDVFGEVYAIELRDLKFPEMSAWESMQQFLGGQFNSFLRPVTDVIRDLDEEANRLWRPDKRGKPRAKEIQDRLKELRGMLNEARDNEDRLQRAESMLGELQQKLGQHIARKAKLIAYIDRCERLNPVRKKLERIEQLRADSDYAADYDDLPAQPLEHLRRIDEEMDGLRLQRDKLEGRKEQLEDVVSSCTPRDRLILDNATEVKLAVRSYDRVKADRDELNNIDTDLKSWDAQLRRCAAEFLVGGWKPEHENAVKAVDAASLRAGIDAFRQAREQYQEQLNRVDALKIRLESKPEAKYVPWLSGALSVIGALGFVLAGASPLGWISALVMAMGAAFILAWWFFGGRATGYRELAAEETRLKQGRHKMEEARNIVKELLKDLPFTEQRLESPDSAILVDIEKLRVLLERIDSSRRKRDAILRRLEHHETVIDGLLSKCGLDYGSADLLERIDILQIALQEAEQRFQNAAAARSQLEDVQAQLQELNDKITKLENDKACIIGRINTLPGKDLFEQVERLIKARDLAQQANNLMEELKREYPDLDDIKRELAELSQTDQQWDIDDAALARAKAERDQIEYELNSLNNEIGTLKKEIELGVEKIRLDEVRGEIAAYEDELLQIARQRDRIMIMKNLILEAEKQFREEHQPDILKKAGKYLSVITQGKYTHLFEKEGDQPGLVVKCGHNDELIEVKDGCLSRGTLEQIYLALRLAFTEHLDPGGLALPLFLDEVFVNWDGFRLENGLELLRNIADKRQVFVFTCHDWFMEKLAGKMDFQVVKL